MASIRAYVDTSVFGGAFDKEFEKANRLFFDRARSGEFVLVVSPAVRDELADAPEEVLSYEEEGL